jgi:DNA-binding transcriptional LysR family regulator
MRDLLHIAVFMKVAETRNLTAAAHELGFTPSAVSRRISRLEENLGVKLLVRTTRHVGLTEAGQAFYEKSAHGLNKLDEAVAHVSQMSRELHGTLRITTPPCFGRLHVTPAASEFLALHPQLTIEVLLGYPNDRVVDSADEVVICSADFGTSHLAFEDIVPMKHVVCAAPDYIARHGVPATPEDLLRHNCLILMRPFPRDEWLFARPDGARSVRVSGGFRADSTEALCVAAMRGLGVARIPDYAISRELADGSLIAIFSDFIGADNRDTGPILTMKAYYLRGPYVAPKIPAFIAFLKTRFSDQAAG